MAGVQRGYNEFAKYASFITNNLFGSANFKGSYTFVTVCSNKRVTTVIDHERGPGVSISSVVGLLSNS